MVVSNFRRRQTQGPRACCRAGSMSSPGMSGSMSLPGRYAREHDYLLQSMNSPDKSESMEAYLRAGSRSMR